jgi:hypothetical protein
MFIIPFIHKEYKAPYDVDLHKISILQVGKNKLWEENIFNDSELENNILTILKHNDIDTNNISIKKYNDNIMSFNEINNDLVNMNDYYNYDEINDNTTFNWRTFYIMLKDKKYWLEMPNNYKINDIPVKCIIDTILANYIIV